MTFDALVHTNIASYLTIHQSNLWLTYNHLPECCLVPYNDLTPADFIKYFNALEDYRLVALATYRNFRIRLNVSMTIAGFDHSILHRICRLAFTGKGDVDFKSMIYWLLVDFPGEYKAIWGAIAEYAVTMNPTIHMMIADLADRHNDSFNDYLVITKDGRFADYAYHVVDGVHDEVMKSAGTLFVNTHLLSNRTDDDFVYVDIISLIGRCFAFHKSGHYINGTVWNDTVYVTLTPYDIENSKSIIRQIVAYYRVPLRRLGVYKKIMAACWEL